MVNTSRALSAHHETAIGMDKSTQRSDREIIDWRNLNREPAPPMTHDEEGNPLGDEPWRDAEIFERAVAERNAALERVSQLEGALRDAIGRCCELVDADDGFPDLCASTKTKCPACCAALALLDDGKPGPAEEGPKAAFKGRTVECCDCGATTLLPPVPDKPGFVSIESMDGWTAPPARCPACSAREGEAPA